MQTDVKNIKIPLYAHLQDLSLDAAAVYGSKAAVLGVLSRSGLPVPKGMALSSQIYNVFLEHNQFPYECCQYVSHNDEIHQFLLHGRFGTHDSP